MTRRKSWKYKVRVGDHYEQWSGNFYKKKDALEWFKKYGSIHKERGYKLKLFCTYGENSYI